MIISLFYLLMCENKVGTRAAKNQKCSELQTLRNCLEKPFAHRINVRDLSIIMTISSSLITKLRLLD